MAATPEVQRELKMEHLQNDDVLASELVLLEPAVERNTSPTQRESVLDVKRKKSGSKKLESTAKANYNLLQNIQKQRAKSLERHSLKTAGNVGRGKFASSF